MITPSLAFLGSLGPWEIGIVLVLGVLIFGKRLPEVGKNVGKSFVEFKKGLAGVEQETRQATQQATASANLTAAETTKQETA